MLTPLGDCVESPPYPDAITRKGKRVANNGNFNFYWLYCFCLPAFRAFPRPCTLIGEVMKNTITQFSHPTVVKQIRRALWLARLEQAKTGKDSRQYVQNRKGNNYLRISVHSDRSVVIYGDCSRIVTDKVLTAAIKARG